MSSPYLFDSCNYHYNFLFFNCISLYTNGTGVFHQYLRHFLRIKQSKELSSIYFKLKITEPDENDKVVNRYLFFTSIVNLALYFHPIHGKNIVKEKS